MDKFTRGILTVIAVGIIGLNVQMNMKVKQVKIMSIIDFKKVVIN